MKLIKWKYKPNGWCPVQAEGWFLGTYFYFRSRWDQVTIEFCSTEEDWDHVEKWGVKDKSFKIAYGIKGEDAGTVGLFKKKYGISDDVKMFLSCGGYWPNKRMRELAKAFKDANLENSVLVTTGYDNRHDLMPEASDNVIPLMIEDPAEIKHAMADAYCYIMNSDAEGFGLVLLESMLNCTPWLSRNIAGAKLMCDYGCVYHTEEDLIRILKIWETDPHRNNRINYAYDFVITEHLIINTVDEILNIVKIDIYMESLCPDTINFILTWSGFILMAPRSLPPA
jgi:hypothetical protein